MFEWVLSYKALKVVSNYEMFKILTDNGGEFNNKELRDMNENLNTEVLATAAESPWSNGICERHNVVIGHMIDKIKD